MRISVAIATYNGEKYIKTQIKSILTQIRLPDEIVISDDLSTDATLSIIKSFVNNSKPKFKILQNNRRLGYSKNFERALRACTGEVIFLCDQDDRWYPEKIMRMISLSDNALMVHTDAKLVNEYGIVIAESYSLSKKKRPDINIFARILDDNCVTGCTAMIKKELIDMSPRFPDRMPHDQWLALLASDRNSLIYQPETLIDYRQHAGNVIGAGLNSQDINPRSFGSMVKVDRNWHKIKSQFLESILVLLEPVINNKNRKLLQDLIVYHEAMSKRGFRLKSMVIHAKYFESINFRDTVFRRFIKLLATPFRTLL